MWREKAAVTWQSDCEEQKIIYTLCVSYMARHTEVEMAGGKVHCPIETWLQVLQTNYFDWLESGEALKEASAAI